MFSDKKMLFTAAICFCSYKTAFADSYCITPSMLKPNCLSSNQNFDSRNDAEKCAKQIKNLLEEWNIYGDCLTGQAKEAERFMESMTYSFACKMNPEKCQDKRVSR